MRVHSTGNLAVDLIRHQRFDVACLDRFIDYPRCDAYKQAPHDEHALSHRCTDRVQLSAEALAYAPWQPTTCHNQPPAACPPLPPADTGETAYQWADRTPDRITPVVGSAVLSGLGVSLIVPGTLLDVMA